MMDIIPFDLPLGRVALDLLRRRAPQQFLAFDVLWLNGRDLRALPLIERKRRLRKLIPKSGPLLYADHVVRNGCALYAAAREQDLEGVVAKLKTGLYTPQETTWVKIKNPRYSSAEGRGESFAPRVGA